MLTGTLRTSVGARPVTNPLGPDSRRTAATVERSVAYGWAERGDEEGEEEGSGGGSDCILVLTTSIGKLCKEVSQSM